MTHQQTVDVLQCVALLLLGFSTIINTLLLMRLSRRGKE